MYCQKCGNEVADGSAFCNSCGAPVQQPQERFCGECGARISATAKFCNSCGQPVDKRGAGRGRGVGKAIAVVLSLLILIAIVVLVLLLLKGCTGGAKSADALADELETSLDEYVESGLSEDAAEDFIELTLDSLPKGVEKAIYNDEDLRDETKDYLGYYLDDRDDMVEMLVESVEDELEYYGDVLDYVDDLEIDIDVSEGDSLKSSERHSIEAELEDDFDLEYEIDEGVELCITLTYTAEEDIDDLYLEEGDRATDTIGYFDAIKINGKWYLWFE